MVKRYKMKPNITLEDIQAFAKEHAKKFGFGGAAIWISEDSEHFLSTYINDDILLSIGFPKDLQKWDDFDHVMVMDEDFGQPFTPFYKYIDGEIQEPEDFVMHTVDKYNAVMDSLTFLEAIE